MPAKIGEQFRYMLEVIALLGQTKKKLVVHHIVVIDIQPIAGVENTATKEGRRGWDVKRVIVAKDETAEFNLASNAVHTSIFVHVRVVPIKDVDIRTRTESVNDGLETTGTISIIGVEPPDDLS